MPPIRSIPDTPSPSVAETATSAPDVDENYREATHVGKTGRLNSVGSLQKKIEIWEDNRKVLNE